LVVLKQADSIFEQFALSLPAVVPRNDVDFVRKGKNAGGFTASLLPAINWNDEAIFKFLQLL